MFFSRLFVTLEEISAFLCIKAVWGIEEKLGYELATVLNSTFCYKLLNALGFAASLVEEHLMLSLQPFMTHHRVPLDLWSLATNGTQER